MKKKVRKTLGGAVSVVTTPWEQPVHSLCRLASAEMGAASLGGVVAVSPNSDATRIIDSGPVYSVVSDEVTVMCSFRLEDRAEHRVFDRDSFALKGNIELAGSNTLLSRSALLGNMAIISNEAGRSAKLMDWTAGSCCSELQLKEPCLDSLLFQYRNQEMVAAMSSEDIVVKAM